MPARNESWMNPEPSNEAIAFTKFCNKLITSTTWVLYVLMRRWLPKKHPWHPSNRKINLESWAAGSTDLNFLISIQMWVGNLLIIAGIIRYLIGGETNN